MDLPAPAGPDCIRRIKVWTPDEMGNGGAFRVALPPWGYLEGVELRLRELVPNMDADRDSRRPGDTTLACPHCGETLRGHLELIHRRAEV